MTNVGNVKNSLYAEGIPKCSYKHEITYPPPSPHEALKTPYGNLQAAFVERYALQTAAGRLVPDERVSGCLRRKVTKADVELWHIPATETARFGLQLMVCGSVWHCPVCASKIAARRVQELEQAIATWQNQHGGQNLMMTFTIQHRRGESCAYVLDGLLKAHIKFWAGEPAQRFKARYGIEHKIRSLEVTEGLEGWHTHLHTLLFCKGLNLLFVDDMRAAGAERWQSILARNDRYADLAHGVHIRSADDFVAEYVLKFQKLPEKRWTPAHELAHSHKKMARSEGRTPMTLLQAYNYGDDEAGQRWVEYAQAFKGKRQLVWSKGLRELLKLGEEKTDEQLATEQTETGVLIARFGLRGWKAVIDNDIRAEVLWLARKKDGQVLLRQYLQDLGITDVEYPGLEDTAQIDGPVMDVIVYEAI